MNYKKIYSKFSDISEQLKSFALLLARFAVAYGFYQPAILKWKNIENTAIWFESLSIPMPMINAYMSAITESLGVVLLALGLFTRLISIPLIVIMLVAILTVHFQNGFSAGNNGYEIPLYYGLFLMLFLSHGAGKFSLDRFIFRR